MLALDFSNSTNMIDHRRKKKNRNRWPYRTIMWILIKLQMYALRVYGDGVDGGATRWCLKKLMFSELEKIYLHLFLFHVFNFHLYRMRIQTNTPHIHSHANGKTFIRRYFFPIGHHWWIWGVSLGVCVCVCDHNHRRRMFDGWTQIACIRFNSVFFGVRLQWMQVGWRISHILMLMHFPYISIHFYWLRPQLK